MIKSDLCETNESDCARCNTIYTKKIPPSRSTNRRATSYWDSTTEQQDICSINVHFFLVGKRRLPGIYSRMRYVHEFQISHNSNNKQSCPPPYIYLSPHSTSQLKGLSPSPYTGNEIEVPHRASPNSHTQAVSSTLNTL